MDKTFIDIIDAVPRLTEFQFSRPINWKLRQNEHWTFLGPNGSGKTLLARIIKGECFLRKEKIKYRFEDDRSIYQQRWNPSENEIISVEDILKENYAKEEILEFVSFFNVNDLLKKSIILYDYP